MRKIEKLNTMKLKRKHLIKMNSRQNQTKEYYKAILITPDKTISQIEIRKEYSREFAPKYFNQEFFDTQLIYKCSNNIRMVFGESPCIGEFNGKIYEMYGEKIRGNVIIVKTNRAGEGVNLKLEDFHKMVEKYKGKHYTYDN